jgi:sugar phosphate isomerase/epimerase
MNFTRREFGKLALAGIPSLGALGMNALASGAARAAAAPATNISYIHGVQFGLQPFCYHDLPMNTDNRSILIQRMVQNKLGMVELHATWFEPRFAGPGVSLQDARDQLRNWRLNPPTGYLQKVKKEFNDVGITIFSVWLNFSDANTDDEIDAVFENTKALGAKGVIGSWGLAVSKRLTPFPAKHGMFAGLHNHDNLSDPDAYSTIETFEKGLAMSPDFKANLDVRHFTAANGDCLAFMEKHHDRMCSVHLGDRRKNNGRSTPFGQGDAPIIEILRMIRDNQWPIIALLEFEHGTLLSGVEEVQICYDYCKRAVA